MARRAVRPLRGPPARTRRGPAGGARSSWRGASWPTGDDSRDAWRFSRPVHLFRARRLSAGPLTVFVRSEKDRERPRSRCAVRRPPCVRNLTQGVSIVWKSSGYVAIVAVSVLVSLGHSSADATEIRPQELYAARG